jgi:putative two-component system response regulator
MQETKVVNIKMNQNIDKTYLEKFQYIASDIAQGISKHTILIVDDEENNLQLLKRTLRRDYNIITASGGEEALEIVNKMGNSLSMIISDQRMPVMTGTDFLYKTVDKFPHIIKILLTGYSDIEAMIDGVNKCQLFQYLSKPFDQEEIQMVIKNGINSYELTLSKNALLHDLKELFFTTIKSISSALDAKDAYTHGHSLRVTLYSLIMAREMKFEESLMEKLEIAGLLHDIGKIGVPENILCKPGKLTDDEYNTIKMHPDRGRKMLESIKKFSDVSFWLSCHHERWDGRGYPLGLKGEDIPTVARILAIADTYDAMTSNRSYRQGLPHSVAAEEIKRCAVSQFDPEIVEVFICVENIIIEAEKDPAKYYSEYSVINKSFSAV